MDSNFILGLTWKLALRTKVVRLLEAVERLDLNFESCGPCFYVVQSST